MSTQTRRRRNTRRADTALAAVTPTAGEGSGALADRLEQQVADTDPWHPIARELHDRPSAAGRGDVANAGASGDLDVETRIARAVAALADLEAVRAGDLSRLAPNAFATPIPDPPDFGTPVPVLAD